MRQSYRLAPVLLLLALYAAFMMATNHRLTVLDDEAIIVMVANNSVDATLNAFYSGNGQHEHPPLSDLFLHGWLNVTHHALGWLRVSAVLSYTAGLFVLSLCARALRRDPAQWAVLIAGTLWPFGYFYARIAGWYCFCFLLVSLLTFCYLRVLEQPSRWNWIYLTLTAIALLWSNYYGLAILFVLLMDFLLFRRQTLRANPLAAITSAFLMLACFLPLLPALRADAQGTIKTSSIPWIVSIAKIAYVLFAIQASVAVAPWYLVWSLPIAAASLLLLVLMLIDKSSRLLTIGFLSLVLGLALADHLDLKRMLFITPWMMLSIAMLCTSASRLRSRLTIASIALIFSLGWIGIATGRHPATSNFYEPWKAVAETTAAEALQGATIVSDSGRYFFYLNFALDLQATPARGVYLGESVYRHRGTEVYQYQLPANVQPHGKVVLVQGVSLDGGIATMEATYRKLMGSCRLLNSMRTAPDPALAYKRFLGPRVPILPYRVQVEEFDCPASSL